MYTVIFMSNAITYNYVWKKENRTMNDNYTALTHHIYMTERITNGFQCSVEANDNPSEGTQYRLLSHLKDLILTIVTVSNGVFINTL